MYYNNIILQGFKDWQLLILILLVTGIAVLLLLLEESIPQLRGAVIRRRDEEHPYGKTVCIYVYMSDCHRWKRNTILFILYTTLYIVDLILF